MAEAVAGLYDQVCRALTDRGRRLHRYVTEGMLPAKDAPEWWEAIEKARRAADRARDDGDVEALRALARRWPLPLTPREVPEAFDALVDQARTLIAEVGEEQARAQLERGLLESLQDDRGRAETVVAMAVEGAIREARRAVRGRRGQQAAAQAEREQARG